MKKIIFDSSSVISLAMNDLLFVLGELKKRFKVNFYISEAVKKELVDKPLMSKKYKLEAIMISKLIDNKVLDVINVNRRRVLELLDMINSVYSLKKHNIKIVDLAEVEVLTIACLDNLDAIVVDERTLRLLIEDSEKLKELLDYKLHDNVGVDRDILLKLEKMIKNVKVIRSSELMTVAYENGLMNNYLNKKISKKELLDGLLWGVKLRGCAISKQEIEEIKRLER